VGGLLQPGGTFLDDGAPLSPFTIANAKEPLEMGEIKNYIEVINKLIRRYIHFPLSRLLSVTFNHFLDKQIQVSSKTT